jgi:hypothetical protein
MKTTIQNTDFIPGLCKAISCQHKLGQCHRQCKGTSVCFLTSSLLSYSPLFICISFPYLCTISRDYTYSRRLLSWWPDDFLDVDSPEVDDFRPLLTAWTWTAPHESRTHWDRSAWHYGTLCHHMDTYLWEAWW